MKFYGRQVELETLELTFEQSKQSACFTVMVGRRRIGKTSLLFEKNLNKYKIEMRGFFLEDM